MADILKWVEREFQKRWRDMGDGSHAEVIAVGSLPDLILAALMLEPNGTQADQRLTVDATLGGVQFAAFHADTTHVFWSCEDAQCRVTFDGSAPTATNGHIINVFDSGVWTVALATAARFIRTGGTSAIIHASQMR